MISQFLMAYYTPIVDDPLHFCVYVFMCLCNCLLR